MIMGGNVIVAASVNMIETLKACAAKYWGIPLSDVTYEDGHLRTYGRRLLSLAELAVTPLTSPLTWIPDTLRWLTT